MALRLKFSQNFCLQYMPMVNFQVEKACIDPKQIFLVLSQVIPAQSITNAIESTCISQRFE